MGTLRLSGLQSPRTRQARAGTLNRNQEGYVTPPHMMTEREPNPPESEMPLMTRAVTNFVGSAEAAAPEGAASPIRQFLKARGSGGVADRIFIGSAEAAAPEGAASPIRDRK